MSTRTLAQPATPRSSYSAEEIAEMLRKPTGRVRNVAPRSQRTYNGVVYDSKAEALYAFNLDSEKAAGKIRGWARQVTFPLDVNGIRICKFVVDFYVVKSDGSKVIYEVKGWETPEYKLKFKLFKALYPDIPYKTVKA